MRQDALAIVLTTAIFAAFFGSMAVFSWFVFVSPFDIIVSVVIVVGGAVVLTMKVSNAVSAK